MALEKDQELFGTVVINAGALIDPNLTNVLIGEDWTIWRIDFSRAFLPSKDLREPSY